MIRAVVSSEATWASGSSLEAALAKVGGDIVQSIQALKESGEAPSHELERLLRELLSRLEECRQYCENVGLEYLFGRAERQLRDVLVYLFPEHADDIIYTSPEDRLDIKLKANLPVEMYRLGTFDVPRLFNGFWQLSSPAWGSGTTKQQTISLTDLVEAGLIASDMADHYVSRLTRSLVPCLTDRIYRATLNLFTETSEINFSRMFVRRYFALRSGACSNHLRTRLLPSGCWTWSRRGPDVLAEEWSCCSSIGTM